MRKLTITMSDRRPVKIDKDQWPIVAEGREWDGELECQSACAWRVVVRRHADGRAIVYGVRRTYWRGEFDLRAGVLLAAPDDAALIAAITTIADALGGAGMAGQRCVAALPPEAI